MHKILFFVLTVAYIVAAESEDDSVKNWCHTQQIPAECIPGCLLEKNNLLNPDNTLNAAKTTVFFTTKFPRNAQRITALVNDCAKKGPAPPTTTCETGKSVGKCIYDKLDDSKST